MGELTVSQARENLAELIDNTRRSGEPVVLTRHGRPVAVVLDHALFERLVAAVAWADEAESRYKAACEAERTAILHKELVIRGLSDEATGSPPAWGPAYKELLHLFGEGTEKGRQAAAHLLKRLEERKPMVVDAGGIGREFCSRSLLTYIYIYICIYIYYI